MPDNRITKAAEQPTRRALLDVLKRAGARKAGDLSEELGVSAMAVRQHLYALQEEGLVGFSEEPRPGGRPQGRPAKLWRLTDAAARYFPDAHAELTVGLLQSMKQAFGEAGLNRLLSVRGREQADAYTGRLDAEAADGRGGRHGLRARLETLAAIRTEEGYMAEIQDSDDGGFLLIENHCPICRAAAACTGLCAAELLVFRAVLGPDVTIERTDHILAGARRCAYRVAAR
jgi:predicted ArsR family transcriptional regulator